MNKEGNAYFHLPLSLSHKYDRLHSYGIELSDIMMIDQAFYEWLMTTYRTWQKKVYFHMLLPTSNYNNIWVEV